MKTSTIQAFPGGVVLYDGELLTMRVIEHLMLVFSKDWSFAWGRNGAGVFLAAAILIKLTGDDDTARLYCLALEGEILSKFPANKGFELPIDRVRVWLREKQKEGVRRG